MAIDRTTPWDIKTSAPNGRDTAILHYADEVRYGPTHFLLNLNGKVVRDRIFGLPLEWSDDSRFLAAQEWLTVDYAEGPVTRIVLIEIRMEKLCVFRQVIKGFAQDVKFTSQSVLYRKHYYGASGSHSVYEAEVLFKDMHNWISLEFE